MTGQILHLLEIILNKIILYVFFWVFPPRLIVVRRHFGTLYQFHPHRLDILHIQPMKMEHIECSQTSAYNNQTPGKYPKEYIQDSKHGESLKSRIQNYFQYNNRCFQPNKRVATASHISSTLAEIQLQFLEEMYTKLWPDRKEMTYYKRYVDDILIISNQNKTKENTIKTT